MKQPTEEIPRICAWCNAKLGYKTVTVDDTMAGKPTHGICQECYDAMLIIAKRLHKEGYVNGERK
jgi:hypothetical protein